MKHMYNCCTFITDWLCCSYSMFRAWFYHWTFNQNDCVNYAENHWRMTMMCVFCGRGGPMLGIVQSCCNWWRERATNAGYGFSPSRRQWLISCKNIRVSRILMLRWAFLAVTLVYAVQQMTLLVAVIGGTAAASPPPFSSRMYCI